MRYTKEAMDALTDARQNNPNVSQRRLAFNIFMLVRLDQAKGEYDDRASKTTLELFNLLGNPSEVALQHLIRGIDRQARNNATGLSWARDRATLRRKTRSSRSRKIARNRAQAEVN